MPSLSSQLIPTYSVGIVIHSFNLFVRLIISGRLIGSDFHEVHFQ